MFPADDTFHGGAANVEDASNNLARHSAFMIKNSYSFYSLMGEFGGIAAPHVLRSRNEVKMVRVAA